MATRDYLPRRSRVAKGRHATGRHDLLNEKQFMCS
jgi:hypothetical protein